MTQELLGRVHRELLDVLNSINQDKIHHDGDDFHELLNDVEKALAQPEQEPVAYINIEERKLEWAYKYMSWDTPTVVNLPKIPLYTTPPQRTWVGLTDEDITELHYEIKVRLMGTYKTEDIYRAIEAKLKEKNNG